MSARRIDGRWVIAAVLVSYFAVLFVASQRAGSIKVWERAGVPALSPAFADLRVITAGLESARDGYDALVNNPRDPWKRPINYPRVWVAAKFLGITQQHTVALGFLIAAGFFATLFLTAGRIGLLEGAVYAVLVCSPTLMLALERGNIDLIMFALLATAAALWSRKQRAAVAAVIVSAAILKLYPICALFFAVRDKTRAAIIAAGAGAIAFGVYVLATRHDIAALLAATPAARFPAYGRELLFLMLEDRGFGGDPVLHSLLFVSVMFVGALLLALKLPAPQFTPGAAEMMIIGFAVYAMTFSLMSSFSYRLVFLLLALPQLFCWCRRGGASRYFALANLFLIAVALYLAAISEQSTLLTKEVACWLLLGSAFFVLVRAALSREQVVHGHDDECSRLGSVERLVEGDELRLLRTRAECYFDFPQRLRAITCGAIRACEKVMRLGVVRR